MNPEQLSKVVEILDDRNASLGEWEGIDSHEGGFDVLCVLPHETDSLATSPAGNLSRFMKRCVARRDSAALRTVRSQAVVKSAGSTSERRVE